MEMTDYDFRPFGSQKCDLDINFDSPRPRLVSEVLNTCLIRSSRTAPERDSIEGLPVGERLAMLIKLVQSCGLDILTVTIACERPECGQSYELELDLPAFYELHRTATVVDRLEVENRGSILSLRRPTAEDQYRWQVQNFKNTKQAAEQMALSIVVESDMDMSSPIPEATIQAIGKVLQSADPLLAPMVRSECPDCGNWQEQPLDLGLVLLHHLEGIQTGVLEAIHQIARAYHWTEEQILNLPVKRREQYLNLISREG